MSRIHAKAASVYKDEIDLGGVTNSIVIDIDNGVDEITSFADVDATYLEGKARFAVTLNGLWAKASPNYDSEMFGDLTSLGRQLGIYPNQAGDGEYGREGVCNIEGEDRDADKESVLALHIQWRGDGAMVRTIILEKDAAVASTLNGTGRNFGAVGAGEEAVAIIRLLSAPGGSGSNNCVVTIESDSANNFAGAQTTRMTFTTLNQASAVTDTPEVKTVAGAITNTWWRSVVTISGGGSRTFDLLIVFGIRLADG